jgi:UPF0271 protein
MRPRYHGPVRAVLDSSAVLEGFDPVPPDEFAVPPSVVEEVSKGRAGRRMRALVDAGLAVIEPDGEARSRVMEAVKELGEQQRLSAPDIDVLALSMSLGVPCVTDDYSIQNVMAHLGLEAVPFRERGIKEVWRWTTRCPACGRTFDEDVGPDCPVCGNPLRTAPRR